MDITTPLIFIAIFVFASLSLFLVYKFGMKEKSYEEALAEQRQHTNTLLGFKPKPKEKKNKKAAKKSKEKPLISTETETTDEAEVVENNEISEKNKPHVEFKEEPEEVTVPVKEVSVPNKREDLLKQEPVKEKTVKEKKQNSEAEPHVVKNAKKTKQQQQEKINNTVEPPPPVVEKEKEIEEIVPEIVVSSHSNGGNMVNTGKEKKKRKSEFNSKQQLTAERDQLINSVRIAELSRNEVQMLIDLLLNKQLEAPTVIDEWSEGKFDPVQKLKKQLSEKEKALIEEQEALVGAQMKLKEVRAEQLAERSQLQQKIRGFEEVLQAKHLEFQAANNRLQVNTQKMQQLQAENNALQMQRQQLEVRIVQIQETEALMVKLRNDNEDFMRQNQGLSMELQRLSQELATEKEHQQHYILQLNNKQKEFEQFTEHTRQLEDTLKELQMDIPNLNATLQQQFEKTRRAELNADQLQEEVRLLTSEKVETAKVIAQLKAEIHSLHSEKNSQVNGSHEENKAHKIKILNLTNELSSLKSELFTVNSKFQEAERTYKTALEASDSACQKLQMELEEQKTKNNDLRKKNWKVIEALNVAESRSKSGSTQSDVHLDSKIKEEQSSPPPENTHEVAKLQGQLNRYKNIIDDTEGMLNKLQSHIEQEERNWRSQLAKKEAEIESLKESQLAQLQAKVGSLENQLSRAESEKNRLLQERQLLSSKPEIKSIHSDATATIEQLSEEVNRLREQLRVEQTKNGDLSNVCLKAQNNRNSNSTNGPFLIEHCLSSSSSIASCEVAEVNKKSKNKKKKKKGNGN